MPNVADTASGSGAAAPLLTEADTGLQISVELSIRSLGSAWIVFEQRQKRTPAMPVRILHSPAAARRWAHAHYSGVRWHSAIDATGLIGSLAGALDLKLVCRRQPPVPIAFQSSGLRAFLPEVVMCTRGPMIIQRVELLDVESDRWEPSIALLWEAPPCDDPRSDDDG